MLSKVPHPRAQGRKSNGHNEGGRAFWVKYNIRYRYVEYLYSSDLVSLRGHVSIPGIPPMAR